jgi:hypothetical protein
MILYIILFVFAVAAVASIFVTIAVLDVTEPPATDEEVAIEAAEDAAQIAADRQWYADHPNARGDA